MFATMQTGRRIRTAAADNGAVHKAGHVAVVVAILLVAMSAAAQNTDWQQQVRAAAQAQRFDVGLAIVEQRLDRKPDDLEAKAWKARLLGWSGDLPQAEALYRQVLREAPGDADVMVGLADVLTWEGKLDEAVAQLQNAPPTADVLLRRARLLVRLNRQADATPLFREVLLLDPANQEATRALHENSDHTRNELIIGADTDRFNYTDVATAQSLTLVSHWNERWTTGVSSSFYQRFGAGAHRVTMRVSRTFGRSLWISLNGGGASDGGVVPKREAGWELGHAFRLSDTRPVRGLETSIDQQWFWFQQSRVQVISATALFYLPHEWTFTLSSGGASSSFPIREVEWEPTGSVRLGFPTWSPRLTGHALFAVGAENFAKADEIGHFSAHTYGGGFRYEFARRQDVRAGVYFQQRSQAKTQTTVTLSYAIRF